MHAVQGPFRPKTNQKIMKILSAEILAKIAIFDLRKIKDCFFDFSRNVKDYVVLTVNNY